MGTKPIEELLPKAGGSVYSLIRIASERALELSDGKKPLVDVELNTKLTTIALEEIKTGKVVIKSCADLLAKKEPEKEEEDNQQENK